MTTLDFIRDAREPMAEADLWVEIQTLRRVGANIGSDMPTTYSEFQRQVRVLVIAGKVRRLKGSDMVEYVPEPMPAKERTLF